MSNSYRPPSDPPYTPYQPVAQRPRRRHWLRTLLLGCLAFVMVAGCIVLVMGGTFFVSSFVSPFFSLIASPTPVPPTRTPLPRLKVYTVVGKPTLDAAFINSVLEYYGSPASGKGQALYDDGVKYGINPAYALAFFLEESNFGTKGVATVTHALGNIRADTGEPQYNGYRLYKTWEAGFTDWYTLMSGQYVAQWHLATIEQIIPVYAPSNDNNDEAQYISTIKIAVERWRNGYVDV